MSEDRNAPSPDDRGSLPRGCDRAEEFVTYLYGEATPEESRRFRLHLEACGVCREELASLGGVREAVGAWRAEALGTIPSLDIADAFASAGETPRPRDRGRSAAAALREFFSLSPLWLRAGVTAAALAVCALAALTLARAEVTWDADGLAFRAGVTERVVREQVPVPAPVQAGYTEEQVAAIVERRVAEAAAQLRGREAEKVVNVSDGGRKHQRASATPNAQRRRRAPRPAARDEALLAGEDLPRLSDLLGGSY